MSIEFQPIALPIAQAAKLIGRSPSLLYQEIKLGRLRAYAPQRAYRTKQNLEARTTRRSNMYVLVDDLKAWVRGENNSNAAA